jgi:branched-chain amino acid transport system permease protein
MPKNPQWLRDLDIEVVTSLRLAIPVIMLFVVLLWLPHAPLRASGIQRVRESVAMPPWRRSLVGVAVVVSATLVLSGMLSNADLVAWGKLFGYGLVMLSLVPLTGYGGQISLAQLSFAGLGAMAVGRWGSDGSPLGVVLALVLAGAVGALVALPALRLRGIYLALATLAFAVFMDKVVFTQQALFKGGSLPVARPKVGPFDFSSPRAYVILMALVFCACALFVVWLRRGPFGRRLLAMKDSPAACATLGMNLTVTKLQVFVISAALAGLGGALLAGLQGTATPSDYEVLRGLPILLLAVAGGISMVSGSLLGGTFLASFAILPGWVPAQWEIAGFNARNAVVNLLLVLPALMGISLARNPNGAAHEIGSRVMEALGRNGERGEEEAVAPRDPELLGIDRPLRVEDMAAVDALLGLDEEVIGAAARA